MISSVANKPLKGRARALVLVGRPAPQNQGGVSKFETDWGLAGGFR
jgi:hypothetical protein